MRMTDLASIPEVYVKEELNKEDDDKGDSLNYPLVTEDHLLLNVNSDPEDHSSSSSDPVLETNQQDSLSTEIESNYNTFLTDTRKLLHIKPPNHVSDGDRGNIKKTAESEDIDGAPERDAKVLKNNSDAESDASDHLINIENALICDLVEGEYEEPFAAEENSEEQEISCPACDKLFSSTATRNRHLVKRHNMTLGEQFTCHVCGATGSSRSSLRRHLKRTHKLTNMDHPQLLTRKCFHCGIGFPSHNELYIHIRSEHSDKLEMYHHCPCCPALMRMKASFIRHLKRAHPGEEERYISCETCTICEKQFPHRLTLQQHMNKEHPDDCLHTCSLCGTGFKYPYLLSKHMLSHENYCQSSPKKKKDKKMYYTCEHCSARFSCKDKLQRHIQSLHINPDPSIWECKECHTTLPASKQRIRNHRRFHMRERQKVYCRKCDIKFSSPEECMQHKILHVNTCHICKKQFLRNDSFREHMMIHSEPRHECPHCLKKFTQSSNLKRHIRIHTGEKPYKCSYCNRKFGDKSACNSHIRVHTGAERSSCPICGASFSKRQRLNYHMRIHTGKGLLYCPLCNKPTTNSYSLRKHVESHRGPLVKSLSVLGFQSVLDEGDGLVIQTLHLLTSVALKNQKNKKQLSKFENEEEVLSSGKDASDTKNGSQVETELILKDFLKKILLLRNEEIENNKELIALEESKNAIDETGEDGLFKQYIEVILKEEPIDRDEDEEDPIGDVGFDAYDNSNPDYYDDDPAKEEIKSEGTWHSDIDALTVCSIPKIKISKKFKKDTSGKEPIFVAEMISTL